MEVVMEWEALSKFNNFLCNGGSFKREELIELTILICAGQKEVGKLAIYIDTDEEVNPLSIEIFDDEIGILNASGLQSEMIDIFGGDSNLVAQEFLRFDDDNEEFAQYEVYFLTENSDLESWTRMIKRQVEPAVRNYDTADKLENMFKEFCLKALEVA